MALMITSGRGIMLKSWLGYLQSDRSVLSGTSVPGRNFSTSSTLSHSFTMNFGPSFDSQSVFYDQVAFA